MTIIEHHQFNVRPCKNVFLSLNTANVDAMTGAIIGVLTGAKISAVTGAMMGTMTLNNFQNTFSLNFI